ncbi:MAG: hypothetical protein HRU75_05240 [Planctomycetia bacterium]|nr:MAG: hypothetical protein HRU75_05240 [Planctomycetia bacterium]
MRWLAYLWASPTTLLGALMIPVALLSGGRVRAVLGIIEVYGGAVALFLRHVVPLRGGATAMTLGHVVLGLNREALDRTRAHELVHVRQCERWGPLFIPAYLLAGAWALLRGRDPYRDNPFEREAFAKA